jgi:hypothetical protein
VTRIACKDLSNLSMILASAEWIRASDRGDGFVGDSMNDLAALLAEIGPVRAVPSQVRVGRYADYNEAKLFIALAALDGYRSVCVPASLYATFNRTLTPGRQVWDINEVRLVEDHYLRDDEIVAIPPGVMRG